jgi:hypothetical protein
VATSLHLITRRTSVRRLRACAVLQRPQQQSAGWSACRGVSLQNLKPCVSCLQRGPRTAGGTKSVSGTFIGTNRHVMAGSFGEPILLCRWAAERRRRDAALHLAVRTSSGTQAVWGKAAGTCSWMLTEIIPLKTRRRPLYLKTQSVPRCKHFSSRL